MGCFSRIVYEDLGRGHGGDGDSGRKYRGTSGAEKVVTALILEEFSIPSEHEKL